jgi:hypothetical protein
MIRLVALLSLLVSEAMATPSSGPGQGADWVIELARSRIARAERMALPPVLIPGPVERVERPSSFEVEIKVALQGALGGGHAIDLRAVDIYTSPDHGHLVVCGEANARNIYGAIIDFDRFVVVMADPDLTLAPQSASAYGLGWIEAACARLGETAGQGPAV